MFKTEQIMYECNGMKLEGNNEMSNHMRCATQKPTK